MPSALRNVLKTFFNYFLVMPRFVLQGTDGSMCTFIALHKSMIQLNRYNILNSLQQWLFSLALSHPFGHVSVYSIRVDKVVEFS